MKKLISCALVLCMSLCALCGCSEKIDPEKAAMYSDNYQITKGMLSYYFNTQYASFVTGYKDYLNSISLDTSKSLSSQKCVLDTSKASWYEYFMDLAKSKMNECLAISEKALSEEVTLSKKELAKIDTTVDNIKTAAKDEGTKFDSYLKKCYGEDVSEEDIRKCNEMLILSSKYYDNYTKKLKISDKLLNDYYEGHKKLYCTVDFLSFTVLADDTTTDAFDTAQSSAYKIAEAKTPDEFKKNIRAYVKKYYKNKYGDDYSDKEVKEAEDMAVGSCEFIAQPYGAGYGAAQWAFNPDRKIGDTTVIPNTSDGTYTAYYLISLPVRKEYDSVNLRNILFTADDFGTLDKAKETADKCLEELKLTDEPVKLLKKFAKKYSADDYTKNNGGLYEKLDKTGLNKADEVVEWAFSDTRKEGDFALIETAEYGWHLLYLQSFGEPAWKIEVKRGYLDSQFERYVSDICDEYVIHSNSNIINRIKEVDLSNSTKVSA